MSYSIKPIAITVFLLLLGGLPAAFGALQLTIIPAGASGPNAGLVSSAHYFVSPWPITVHIGAGILFLILGPWQFLPALRRRWPGLHRLTGRIYALAMLAVALTALWMNQQFPAFGGWLKYSSNLLFPLAMLAALYLAIMAARARDFATHRTWMVRGYAIGLGVATQRVILLPFFLMWGDLPELMIGLGLWGGWLVNLAVAELWLRRTAPRRVQRQPVLLPAQ